MFGNMPPLVIHHEKTGDITMLLVRLRIRLTHELGRVSSQPYNVCVVVSIFKAASQALASPGK
jgi:hypothetical protein